MGEAFRFVIGGGQGGALARAAALQPVVIALFIDEMDDTGVLSLVGLDQVGIIGHAEAASLPRKPCRFPAFWGHDDAPPPSPCGAASFGFAASYIGRASCRERVCS